MVLSSQRLGVPVWERKIKLNKIYLEMALPSKQLANQSTRYETILWTPQNPESEAKISQDCAQNDQIL